MHWTDKNTRKQIQNDHSLIYQSESWFNKSLPGGSESWTHLDLPHLLFSMEKTDLDFIGLHTWKKFTPYAKHNRTASVLLPNLRQYSGSKHFKAQWWHTDSEPPVFNKELQWNLKTIHVHLRNPPTIERYQHNLMTVTILNQKEESSFDCLSLTAVFKKIRPLAPQITWTQLLALASFLTSDQFSFTSAPGWRIERTLGYNIPLDAKLRGPNYSQEPLASKPCKS